MRHRTAAICIAIVVTLDQITKRVVEGALSDAPHSIPVAPFFNLTLGYNRGISFGLFKSDNPYMPYVLAFAALLIAGGFTVWLLRADGGLAKSGLTLIVGGAISNAMDRLEDGVVTDFLDIYAGTYHWPTFNLADIAIACGFVILLVEPVWRHQNIRRRVQ